MTMSVPTEEQLPAIEALLLESGLPADDLRAQDLSLFRVEGTDDRVSAVGGLERCGSEALIRSIATTVPMRGRGIAGQIVEELETVAADEGFRTLYLLTTSAKRYFDSRGYARVDRHDVPQSVRESRQFSALCPDTATVMCKRIGPEPDDEQSSF